MEFSDALVYLKDGQTVARTSWAGKTIKIGEGTLGRKTILYASKDQEGVYLPSNADILAADWEVVGDLGGMAA